MMAPAESENKISLERLSVGLFLSWAGLIGSLVRRAAHVWSVIALIIVHDTFAVQ